LVAVPEELQVVLAEVELLAVAVLWWEGRVVPRLHLVPPQLNLLNVLHLCELLVLAQLLRVKVLVALPLLLAVVVINLALLPPRAAAVAGLRRLRRAHRVQVEVVQRHPLVHTAVELAVVHIVLILVGGALHLAPLNDAGGVELVIAPPALQVGADLQRQAHHVARHRDAPAGRSPGRQPRRLPLQRAALAVRLAAHHPLALARTLGALHRASAAFHKL
jgi:hypothetical protein